MFPAKTKTILPKAVGTLSLDLRWAIPTDFYGKPFPRSGCLKDHFVTIDTGVIDANFREITQVLILNYHPEKTFTVRTEDRIAQVVFMENFNASFHKLSDSSSLGKTKRRNDGFGSIGVQVIKKAKKEDEIELTTSESEFINVVNSEEDFPIATEKSEENSQITSEKAIMTVKNEVVFHESIIIDE